MALIDPKDAENIYNESGWAARRKEAREWRDAFTAKEILEAVDELPDDLGEEQPKYPIGVSLIQVFAETRRAAPRRAVWHSAEHGRVARLHPAHVG